MKEVKSSFVEGKKDDDVLDVDETQDINQIEKSEMVLVKGDKKSDLNDTHEMKDENKFLKKKRRMWMEMIW